MITTGELKKGLTIELDGQIYQIVEYQHIKMGRGSAQVRLRLRTIPTGPTIERTFQAGDRFNRVWLEHRPVQYQYEDDGMYHFMDMESFDQIALSAELLGDAVNYLKENMTCDLLRHGDTPVSIELPPNVELRVEETDPGLRGDTASGGTKPAKLETGLVIQVPLFIQPGELIRVDTRDGSYIERAG